MKNITSFLVFSLAFLCLICSCKPKPINVQDYDADVLALWNKEIMQIAKEEDGLMTLKGLRTTTLMHLAVHDALNSIVPKYRTYNYKVEAENVNPFATAAFCDA